MGIVPDGPMRRKAETVSTALAALATGRSLALLKMQSIVGRDTSGL
jgi:hypothetical protein